MPAIIDPEIPSGTSVERIRLNDEDELSFKSAELEDVGTDELADYRLSIVTGASGRREFRELVLEQPKVEVELETEDGEKHSGAMVIGNVGKMTKGVSRVQAHVEFYDEDGD